MSYKHPEVFGLFHAVRTPDRGEQYPVGDDSPGMLRQIDKQVKLLGREANLMVSDHDRPGREIDLYVSDLDRGGIWYFRHGCSPERRTHSRQQFVYAEGLG